MSSATNGLKSQLQQQIQKQKLWPKKSLGQRFLINSKHIQTIVSTVQATNPNLIIEIGPGWGALTKPLLLLKKPLAVIEVDHVLAQHWKTQGVRVFQTSALKADWGHITSGPALKPQEKPQDSRAVDQQAKTILVGNLPYHIAGRLLVGLCPGPLKITHLVFMFQKEMAQRITAPPGGKSYGLISVLAQCFWDIRLLLEAGTGDFYPRPKVAGQVLVFKKKKPALAQPKDFVDFVKFCFAQRRKHLLKRLSQQVVGERALMAFKALKLNKTLRAESLSPSQFVDLFKLLKGP